MSRRPQPLRPLVLTWAVFAVVPWIAVEAGRFEAARLPLWALELAAVGLTAWVVQSRRPVGWPRLATAAAGGMFVLAAVRLVVLPSAVPPPGAGPAEAARQLDAAWLWLGLLEAAFVFASGVLASVSGEALLRRN